MDKRMTLREKLLEKREDLPIKQGQIGAQLGIQQSTVSHYERNTDKLMEKGPDFVQEFIRAYGFTAAEAQMMTRDLFRETYRDLFAVDPLTAQPTAGEPVGDVVELPLVGEVAGGYGLDAVDYDEIEMINIPLGFLEGSRAEDCQLRKVTGNSMACDDVRKEIPEGATVIYDTTLEPISGDIVLCRLWVGDVPHLVLKVWDTSRDWVELRSYNENSPPIVLTSDMRCDKVGVYINHLGIGRRQRRRR